MAVPSTATWTLDTDELISAAMERLRKPQEAGYDIKIARRSIQFTFAKLATMGINLATVDLETLDLSLGVVAYALPADTQDVLEMTYRDTAEGVPTDLMVTRISRDLYHYLPDKNSPGSPNQFFVDRQRDAPVLYIWMKPDRATYRLSYYRIRKFRDVGNMTDHLDVPTKWLGLLTAGVAMYIGKCTPDIAPDHRAELAADWQSELADILPEDSDRSPFHVDIDLSCYARL